MGNIEKTQNKVLRAHMTRHCAACCRCNADHAAQRCSHEMSTRLSTGHGWSSGGPAGAVQGLVGGGAKTHSQAKPLASMRSLPTYAQLFTRLVRPNWMLAM